MTVVLGYDESPGAEQALKVALDVATRFGEPLRLVYGVAPPGGMGEEFHAHQEAHDPREEFLRTRHLRTDSRLTIAIDLHQRQEPCH